MHAPKGYHHANKHTPLVVATVTVPFGDAGTPPHKVACASIIKVKDWPSHRSHLLTDEAKSSNRGYGGWYFCLPNIPVSLPMLPLPGGGVYPLALLNSHAFLWPM